MTVKVDVTDISTVVRCSQCLGWYWAGDGGQRAKGHAVAALHEASVHPGQDQARRAREKFDERAKNVVLPGGPSNRGAEIERVDDRLGDVTGGIPARGGT
jgi:hypothetical protein